MANKATSNAAMLVQVQAIIAGLQKQLPNGQFTLGGVSYTTATVLPVLQHLANALTGAVSAHNDAAAAVSALNAARASDGPLLADIKRYLLLTYGAAANSLAVFGLQPPKARTPLTTEQKAARAAKAAATRAARGTTSKKQKLAVVGDVTGVTITPVKSSAATPPASPAAPSAAQAPATTPTTGK